LRVTYVIEDINPCAWYRCMTPGGALKERGHDVALEREPMSAKVLASDVVVFQRPSKEAQLASVLHLRSQQKYVVIELDDDFWNLQHTNPSFSYWRQTSALRVLEGCLKAADVVTVTTPELAQTVGKFNSNVRVLPNMLPDQYWSFAPKQLPADDTVVIGWAGSATHEADLKLLSGVVEQILEKYERVVFAFAGMPRLPYREHERIRLIPQVPLEEYTKLLGTFDIALAPVVDSTFNRCKSDLKYLEYAMIGLPVVASRIATYERSVEHGANGFLARNHRDWVKSIGRLIEDPALRVRIAANAREFAEARTIRSNIGLWERAYGVADQAAAS